ncbi:MAG: aspartyl-tRNA(Asn)/glutamyl-tRNA(Gln) amidotransferase subunit C [Marivirga sp.]|jgi:aspartyl-tRNA(Asn)/glutamyl-tRNA(Gln) amidotransferase subunit C
MQIDKETVEKIAHLARLQFDKVAEIQMVRDMNNMLSFVEKLQEVDTLGVQPLQSMSFEINNLREDEVAEHPIAHIEALKNAPAKDADFFRVPKVIG